MATLTFAYVDSTAVLGPLDLNSPRASADDLMALADAVRRVGLGDAPPEPVQPAVTRRKGHLAVLADPQDD